MSGVGSSIVASRLHIPAGIWQFPRNSNTGNWHPFFAGTLVPVPVECTHKNIPVLRRTYKLVTHSGRNPVSFRVIPIPAGAKFQVPETVMCNLEQHH